MNFNNMLKNKYLYYFAVALMVINVLGYVSLGSIECVLVLGGAAYLANQFTQNRTVDIFIGLFASNVLFGCGRIKEGLENAEATLGRGAAKAAAECKAAADCAENEQCVNGKCSQKTADAVNGKLAVVQQANNTVDTAKVASTL